MTRDRRHLIAYNTDYATSAGIGPVQKWIDVINFHYLNRLQQVLAAYDLKKPLGYDEKRWVAHKPGTDTHAAGTFKASARSFSFTLPGYHFSS